MNYIGVGKPGSEPKENSFGIEEGHKRIIGLTRYRVVEKFVSINGEGARAGELAVFIRFAGCNLKCTYCDTNWAASSDVEFQWMSKNDIYNYIKDTGVRNITLTGGEPLMQEDVYQLLDLLAGDTSLRVEIETNGSIDIGFYAGISPNRPVFTLDYKLGCSGMEHEMRTENFKYLVSTDTVKFVAGSLVDLETVKATIDKYELLGRCQVHISPVFGKLEMLDIVEFMKQNNLNGVRLQPQLHKIIWHPEARGV